MYKIMSHPSGVFKRGDREKLPRAAHFWGQSTFLWASQIVNSQKTSGGEMELKKHVLRAAIS